METEQDRKDIDKNLKLIAKSSFFVFIGLFISKILSYVYRIIVARNFGPEVYGLFSISIMVLGWFVLFASLGLSEGLIRYGALYKGKSQYSRIRFIFRLSISINLITGILLAIILFFSAEFISINIFHNSNLIIFLKIFSFLIPVYLLSNIFLSMLQAFEKIVWYSFITNILQNIIKLIILIILIFFGVSANSIPFSHFSGFLSIFIIAYFVCKYKIPEIFDKFSLNKAIKKKVFCNFFSYSWPLLFVTAISEIFYWADSFMIGYFRDANSVGFYNAAVPIVLLLLFIPELFLKLFFPLITREYSKGRGDVIKQLSQQVGKWIFILNLPFFIILFLFPGVIINILFGSEYLVASNALKILSIGGFISSLFWIHYNLLFMKGKSRLILYNLLIVSFLNILLCIYFIPKYGILGAAFATTMSKILLGIILSIEVKYHLSIIPFRRTILKIGALSLIPTLVVLLVREIIPVTKLSLILMGLFFFLFYIFLMVVTNCLDKNDFMMLNGIKNKLFNTNILKN